MDKDIFVQNIKLYCALKGVKPTVACHESGAGKNLLNHIESRGSMPSIEKVAALAAYLGVTVSILIGEKEAATVAGDFTQTEQMLVAAYRKASADDRAVVDAALRKYHS